MNDYVGRTLAYVTERGEIARTSDDAIAQFDRPLIILGEPGMGKTRLLRYIARAQSWTFRSAASFVIHPEPATLVPTGKRLVIDGLDELSAAQESDPVYRVLGQLIRAGCPPFILSCRAADWRGAVARQDISAEYSVAPLELSLEPFSEENAIAYLTATLGADRAAEVVSYLDERGLPDLFGNPLTLTLFGEIAQRQRELPETRAELLKVATEIMWNERNDRRDGSPLSGMDKATALQAAGAACAAYVLTGSEAIALTPSGTGLDHVLPVSELQALSNSTAVRVVVGSRLFSRVPEAQDLFKPVHRSIAEYLGARWLARTATDPLARERVLAMMTIDSGVPASLRGLHAWLAQDSQFARMVIATDPYGVLRYGDPDSLSVSEGRALLHALRELQRSNPYFRAEDWRDYSAKGLTHLELRDEVRAILIDDDTSFHLRTLLLGSIHGSKLAAALGDDLREMVLSKPGDYSYAERHAAAQAIIAFGALAADGPTILQSLVDAGDEDSTRLALEILDGVGFEAMGSDFVARAILAYLGLLTDNTSDEVERSTVGPIFHLVHNVPDSMVSGVLDAIATHLQPVDIDVDYYRRADLADTIARLIARQIEIAPPMALDLLKWLRITPGSNGYSQEDQERIRAYVAAANDTRQAIQRHVIFVERDHETAWERIWRLAEVNTALSPRADDVIQFLSEMAAAPKRSDADKERWRDLAAFARRSDGRGNDIIEAARPFAAGNSDLEKFLNELQKPLPTPEWQIKQEARRAAEAAKKVTAWEQHRKDFTTNIAAVRAGELQWSYPIAQAYLARFGGVDRTLAASDRIGEWLGPELQEAGLIGLESTLHRDDLPSAEQVAESYAESRRWNFISPMIAGVAERVTSGRGLEGVRIDVLLTTRIGLDNEHLGERIDHDRVVHEIDAKLRRDPALYERYVRLLVEPSLNRQREHVSGLYGFVRSAQDRPLALRLATEWLQRFDNLPVGIEMELIDVLADAGAFEELSSVGKTRATAGYDSDARRRNWLAIGLLCDFQATRQLIEPVPVREKDLMWHLRDRFRVGRGNDRQGPAADPAALAWIVAQFREHWPYRDRAPGVSSGDTNDWDATEFIRNVVNRLAIDTCAAATNTLAQLVTMQPDGYTELLLAAADQQRRARRELNFPGVSLDRLRDVVCTRPPRTTDDLLAVLRYTIARVNAELRGNDTDSVVKYWRDDNQPRNEDRCTDALAEDIARLLPALGIGRVTQADMPNGKIADLLYMIGDAALPIECKGQWNAKLWTAAGDQLDAFYVRDWRAQDRGIYLVYWFGANVETNFRLKAPPGGAARPNTPAELREALIAAINPGRRGSIWVEVLDLTR